MSADLLSTIQSEIAAVLAGMDRATMERAAGALNNSTRVFVAGRRALWIHGERFRHALDAPRPHGACSG